MATNPMQRKSRNSFLLGMILTLIVCMIIGVLCYFLITSKNKKEEEVRGAEVLAYVLNQDVKSGDEITSGMFTQIKVYANTVPSNYVDEAQINAIKMQDEEGNTLFKGDGNSFYMMQSEKSIYKTIDEEGTKVLIKKDEHGYYKTKKSNNDKEYIKLSEVPTVAKIDMYANTVLTLDALSKSDEFLTDDVRIVEYNMITLPTNINIDDYIDIRLTLPNGQDFIVVSKAKVISIQDTTIGLYLSEEEILMMNSAMVEAYTMTASNFYAIQYVEAGNQEKAGVTYTPTPEVRALIGYDSNIVENARAVLEARFSDNVRTYIDASTGLYAVEKLQNIETGFQEQIEKAKEARENYLQSIAVPTDTMAY
ncbi:MAG: hypothetical protein E7310_02605 [Clostridiales bacterium]|nr:hypothetical protein [Clostridiales bacterium]